MYNSKLEMPKTTRFNTVRRYARVEYSCSSQKTQYHYNKYEYISYDIQFIRFFGHGDGGNEYGVHLWDIEYITI